MIHRFNHVLFGAFTLLLAALNADALRAVVDLSRRDPTASHLTFVPLVTLALLYRSRREIFEQVERPGIATFVGLAIVLAGVPVARTVIAPATGAGSLTTITGMFVAAWLTGFAVCYGAAAFHAALFPLLFVGFMIPIPPAAVDAATLFLKRGSAEVVTGLFTLAGTPFHRSGYVFALPRFSIEIADECSGIRSSIALVLTSLLAGHVFLETGWKKILLVAVVVPFAVIKNGFRIVSLSLLGTYVDVSFITGKLHHEGGIVFYLVGLAVLVPFFLILCNSERSLIREQV